MPTRFLVIGAILSIVLVGCSKKPKFTGKDGDSAAVAKPSPAGDKAKIIAKDKGPEGEKPNWLNDPRYKKDQLPAEVPNSGKPDPGFNNPNSSVAPLPAIPAVPVPPAPAAPPMPPVAPAGKVITKADLNDVWVFVENVSGASGKMPRPELIYAALVGAKSPAADLVKGGYIILPGAKTRESVWAYEKDAPTQGGWIATQNGPEQVSAKEFAQRLGR